MNDIPAGGVLETVTQQRILPGDPPTDDDSDLKPSDNRPRDIFDYMRALKPEETDNHTLWIYREYPPTESGYIDCVKPPIDEAYIKANFGGGTFNLLLKRGSELVRSRKFKVVGAPITPNGNSPQSAAGAGSDLVQIVKMLKENGNGTLSPGDAMTLQMKAFENALAIQRASIPPAMNIEQLTNALRNLRDIEGGGAPRQQAEQPEWLKQLLAAAVPAVVGLVVKMLEPKDALATLKGLGEAFTVMKSVNGTGEAAAPDMGVTLLQQGPSLLRGVADLLGELRRAEEIKAARAAAGAPPAPVALPSGPRSAIPPDRRPPPDPASLPRPTAAEMKNGEPDPEWVWGHVIKMCENGDDGTFAYNFLDQIDAASMKSLRDAKITIEQLKQMIATGAIHPVLVQITQLPNYQKFIGEFYAALMSPEVPAPAAA